MNALVNAAQPSAKFASTIASYIADIVRSRGCLNVCFAGDSHLIGNDNMGGLKYSIMVALTALGVPHVPVGEVTLAAGSDRWNYNSFGNVTKVHAEGGITTATLLAGDSTLGNKTWAAMLAADAPDIVFLCVGSNDTSPGVAGQYEALLKDVFAWNSEAVVVFMTPFDSNVVTVEYYNADTSRSATKETIRGVCRSQASKHNVVIVDSAQAIGLWAPYPIDPTPIVPASTDTGAETVTFTSDPGWYSGQEVTVTATGGNLTAGTTYYVNRASSTTYTFHTTRANGVAGTSAVNLSASITAGVYANWLTANNNNANALFYDSAHLKPEGYMMIGAHAVSLLFGFSTVDVVKMLAQCGPYIATNGYFGAAVSASTAVMCRGSGRKKCLTSLSLYNTDASNASTVTLLRVRYSLDGTTVAAPQTAMTFTVGAGATRAWTWPFTVDPGNRTCPEAHYNEGWSITTATAACNVVATWKNAVV